MKFRITLKSFDGKRIQQACNKLKLSLMQTPCAVIRRVAMPTKIKKFCVLRSPHGDKDSREHFELRFHKTFLDIEAVSPLTIKLLAETELPYGVAAMIVLIKDVEGQSEEKVSSVIEKDVEEKDYEPWAIERKPIKLEEISTFDLDVSCTPAEYETADFEPQDDGEEFSESF